MFPAVAKTFMFQICITLNDFCLSLLLDSITARPSTTWQIREHFIFFFFFLLFFILIISCAFLLASHAKCIENPMVLLFIFYYFIEMDFRIDNLWIVCFL